MDRRYTRPAILPTDDSAGSIHHPMSETRVIAKAVPKSGQEQQVKQLLRDMVAPSLAEPGVKTYDLHQTLAGDAFYLFEIYESQEVFQKHKASPHFVQLGKVLPDLLAEPLEIIELTQIS